MNDKQTLEISEKRRKLLKTAAASAPVIATLQSGAALANTSAHLCVKQAETDPPGQAVSVGSDQWVRVQVTEYKFIKKKNGKVRWFLDLDNNGGGSGTYYKNKDRDGDGVGETVTIPSTKWKLADPVETRQRWVLVMYETDGFTVAERGLHPRVFFPTDTTASPLTASCLASFA